MGLRFGDIEVCPDQRDQNRIKEIVDELVQQLGAFLQIRLTEFGPSRFRSCFWRLQPGNAGNFDALTDLMKIQVLKSAHADKPVDLFEYGALV